MFRTTDIVLIAVMVAATGFTYKIKQQAEDQLAAVHKLEAQIRFEEDTIALLKADWSLLTQPSRLQRLTERYEGELKLKPTDAHQFVSLGELPERVLEIEDLIGGPTDAVVSGNSPDKIKTGAVE